jgi:prepilin-type N-terminal cleavage/methylation domain-containing protein
MKTKSGFSLIEVMCAILLLGFGIAGLTQGINTALKSSKESEHQTIAAWLAAGRIEFLRAKGSWETGVTQGSEEGGLSPYAWRQNIQLSSIEGLYDVEITIEEAHTGKAIYTLVTRLFLAPGDLSANQDRNSPTTKSGRGGPKP